MSHIDLRHPHDLEPAAARQRVAEIAVALERKYQATSHWHGEVLHFQRPGIDGRITLERGIVHVAARLGMLLAPMKSLIEREIAAELGRKLKP